MRVVRWVWAVLFWVMAAPVVAQEMTFEAVSNGGNCNDCNWIAAEGTIAPDTPEKFRLAVEEKFGSCRILVLNSTGGDLAAALRMGRFIREQGCMTAISATRPLAGTPWFEAKTGRCEGACAFVFFGGAVREVYRGGSQFGGLENVLAVHRFAPEARSNINSATTQEIVGQLLLYVMEMGISPSVLAAASRAGTNDTHRLTPEEIQRYRIADGPTRRWQELVVSRRGLEMRWYYAETNGDTAIGAGLSCDDKLGVWVLRAFEMGEAGTPMPDIIANPKYMVLNLRPDGISRWDTEETFSFSSTDILSFGGDGADLALSIRLPFDPYDYSGAYMSFSPSEARVFSGFLSASLEIPEAPTLNLLKRACARD